MIAFANIQSTKLISFVIKLISPDQKQHLEWRGLPSQSDEFLVELDKLNIKSI